MPAKSWRHDELGPNERRPRWSCWAADQFRGKQWIRCSQINIILHLGFSLQFKIRIASHPPIEKRYCYNNIGSDELFDYPFLSTTQAMASSNAAGLYGCPLTCLRVSGPPWCINDNDINDNGEGDRSSTNEGGSEEVKKQQQLESHQSQRQLEPCRLTSASKLKRAQETHSRAEADAIKVL